MVRQGLLSAERYEDVLKTQVDGEPRRTTQMLGRERIRFEFGSKMEDFA